MQNATTYIKVDFHLIVPFILDLHFVQPFPDELLDLYFVQPFLDHLLLIVLRSNKFGFTSCLEIRSKKLKEMTFRFGPEYLTLARIS